MTAEELVFAGGVSTKVKLLGDARRPLEDAAAAFNGGEQRHGAHSSQRTCSTCPPQGVRGGTFQNVMTVSNQAGSWY